jgi:hypothetical protein
MNVYKYGLWLHRLADSILGSLNVYKFGLKRIKATFLHPSSILFINHKSYTNQWPPLPFIRPEFIRPIPFS